MTITITRDEQHAKELDYYRAYRAKDKEKIAAHHKAYRANNKEYFAAYYEATEERRRNYMKDYYHRVLKPKEAARKAKNA